MTSEQTRNETAMWNPAQYLKFSYERFRPFGDLLSQVPDIDSGQIADLGCGTGSLTRTLIERWPDAHSTGIDRSAEMLQETASLAIPGRLAFQQADIAQWKSSKPLDLIVSNAALQWLGNHADVLTRWSSMLTPTGTLAVQMPNRFRTPSQIAIEETTKDPRWQERLDTVGLHRESVKPLVWYVHLLHDLGFQVNAWETVYYHILTGENPVLAWLKGTALPPLLECLKENEQGEFLDAIGQRLKAAYPARNGVTVFPMPRLFFVATR